MQVSEKAQKNMDDRKQKEECNLECEKWFESLNIKSPNGPYLYLSKKEGIEELPPRRIQKRGAFPFWVSLTIRFLVNQWAE